MKAEQDRAALRQVLTPIDPDTVSKCVGRRESDQGMSRAESALVEKEPARACEQRPGRRIAREKARRAYDDAGTSKIAQEEERSAGPLAKWERCHIEQPQHDEDDYRWPHSGTRPIARGGPELRGVYDESWRLDGAR